MQRQYFECIMNSGMRELLAGNDRNAGSDRLAAATKVWLVNFRGSLFPYFAFAQQPFTTTVFVSVSARANCSFVSVFTAKGDISRIRYALSRVFVRAVLFFSFLLFFSRVAFDVGAEGLISSATKTNVRSKKGKNIFRN